LGMSPQFVSRAWSEMTEVTGWKFLYSKRWLGYWALLLVFSVVCVLLGNWQFARRAEARAEIARIDANYDASPVPLADVISSRDAFDEAADKWTPVVLSGVYLDDQQLLVRNRPNSSKVGYEVLAPLQLANGDVFIVDRGWISVEGTSTSNVEIPAVPAGTVEVVARLKAAEPRIEGRVAEGNTIGTISLTQIEEILDVPTYTGAYGLLESETPATATGILAERPERDEGPHLSYALQWYVFIILALLGVLYGAKQEYRTLNPEGQRTKAQDARLAERKVRRGRSDAEDEDALIDAQRL
jgi:cytochrome oxidase assembly protein ShyY1